MTCSRQVHSLNLHIALALSVMAAHRVILHALNTLLFHKQGGSRQRSARRDTEPLDPSRIPESVCVLPHHPFALYVEKHENTLVVESALAWYLVERGVCVMMADNVNTRRCLDDNSGNVTSGQDQFQRHDQ